MTDWYEIVSRDSEKMGENRDCAVRAVTLALGKPYAEVHAAMKRLGRRNRRGTPMWITAHVLESYGYKMVECTNVFPSARTPITVQRELPNRGVYLVRTRSHIFCYRAGKVHDWQAGRRHRVVSIFKIVREK